MNKQGECDLQEADQAHDNERRETELSNLVSGGTGGGAKDGTRQDGMRVPQVNLYHVFSSKSFSRSRTV